MFMTEKEIQSALYDIMEVSLHKEVEGYEPLTTVFHLDRLDALHRAVNETEDVDIHQAIGVSMMMHRHPVVRQQLANAGFFEEGLSTLLDLAAKNDLLSARLVSVFAEAEEDSADLNLSEALVERLSGEMNRALEVWGFAVVDIDKNGFELVFDEDTEICA